MTRRALARATEQTVPVEITARSPAAAAAEIVDAIGSVGIAVHRGPLTRARYFAIASRIGNVFHEKQIYVDPQATLYIRRPDAIPFHTDHARANIVGWLCEVPEQCLHRYLDADRIFSELTARERTALAELRCHCPYPRGSGLDPARPAYRAHVVVRRQGRNRFFWVPQMLPSSVRAAGPTPWIRIPPAARLQRALAAFYRKTAVAPEQADVSVQLSRGEAVFIDNNRFLHGRGPLAPTSPRMLYRLWINTDGWASARDHHLRAPTRARAGAGGG